MACFNLSSRNQSYELTPKQLNVFVTRTEFEDAKKELLELFDKENKLLAGISNERKERDEPISADELQLLMFPVENVRRRIKELTKLISCAQIVERFSPPSAEEIIEVFSNEPVAPIESASEFCSESDANDAIERIPETLFFVKEGVKVVAKPGNIAPFYATVDDEDIGINRLRQNGWVLVDGNDIPIDENSDIWVIRQKMIERDRGNYVRAAKEKYPNAFAPWTEDESRRLLDMYQNQKRTLSDISQVLGRTSKGVSLRLKKLLGVERLPSHRQIEPAEYSICPISITSINPSEITPEKMPDYLDMIERMEKWFNLVKTYAEQQAINNEVNYEGYEITTKNSETSSDPLKIMETIQSSFPSLLLSCVQLKAISYVKKQIGSDDFNERISQFITIKETKSLVKSKESK